MPIISWVFTRCMQGEEGWISLSSFPDQEEVSVHQPPSSEVTEHCVSKGWLDNPSPSQSCQMTILKGHEEASGFLMATQQVAGCDRAGEEFRVSLEEAFLGWVLSDKECTMEGCGRTSSSGADKRRNSLRWDDLEFRQRREESSEGRAQPLQHCGSLRSKRRGEHSGVRDWRSFEMRF